MAMDCIFCVLPIRLNGCSRVMGAPRMIFTCFKVSWREWCNGSRRLCVSNRARVRMRGLLRGRNPGYR
jgi:hypothetical protein